jgi:hypothetical protein
LKLQKRTHQLVENKTSAPSHPTHQTHENGANIRRNGTNSVKKSPRTQAPNDPIDLALTKQSPRCRDLEEVRYPSDINFGHSLGVDHAVEVP